jgi:hypothetical protein
VLPVKIPTSVSQNMTGNINPRFARAIQAAELEEQAKEALKRVKVAREGENGGEGIGSGL